MKCVPPTSWLRPDGESPAHFVYDPPGSAGPPLRFLPYYEVQGEHFTVFPLFADGK